MLDKKITKGKGSVEKGFNTPKEVVEQYMEVSVKKTKIPLRKLLLLGILAGMFIGFGASSSSVAMHGIKDVGIARTVAGCIFPVGLMLIVFVGGELFTGDCMLFMGAVDKRYSIKKMCLVLFFVYISNMIGATFIAALVSYCGQCGYSENALGAFTIKVAMGKANISFVPALLSGILCNILVCAAVLMANAARDIAGKVWAIFFPIIAFVIGGYEHCIANMYYIPAGIFTRSQDRYAERAMELYGYTREQLESINWTNMFVNNLLPVTIGNIIGGMICVGLFLYVIHKEKIDEERMKYI